MANKEKTRVTFHVDGKKYDVKARKGESSTALAIRADRAKKDIEDGRNKITKNMLVKEWGKEWYATYKESSGIEESALQSITTALNKHIYPRVGNMQLKNVRNIHLQAILNSLAGKSKSLVSKVRDVIKQMFRIAKMNNLILENPAEYLEMPTTTEGHYRPITDAEREIIIKVAEYHDAGLWVKMILYCGLRPQETAALRWPSVDIENRVLHVVEARKSRSNRVGETKSKAGMRKIPIPKVYIPDLEAAKKDADPFGYVFKQKTTGSRHTETSMKKMWANFVREMNIKMGCKVFRNALIPPYAVSSDLVPYCLRHTYCTDLQAAGVPINIAKEFMGHEDIRVTAGIYTHHSKAAFDMAAKLIDGEVEPVVEVKLAAVEK